MLPVNLEPYTKHSQKSLHLRNTELIWDHETKMYETETSTSCDRGQDQDQLLWDWVQKSGLETLTSLVRIPPGQHALQAGCPLES